MARRFDVRMNARRWQTWLLSYCPSTNLGGGGLLVISGLSVRYDMPATRWSAPHTFVGRAANARSRLGDRRGGDANVLAARDARPVLINFSDRVAVDIAPRAARVQVVDAVYDGTWELPCYRGRHGAHRRVGSAGRVRAWVETRVGQGFGMR